jgi:hypothetical protein
VQVIVVEVIRGKRSQREQQLKHDILKHTVKDVRLVGVLPAKPDDCEQQVVHGPNGNNEAGVRVILDDGCVRIVDAEFCSVVGTERGENEAVPDLVKVDVVVNVVLHIIITHAAGSDTCPYGEFVDDTVFRALYHVRRVILKNVVHVFEISLLVAEYILEAINSGRIRAGNDWHNTADTLVGVRICDILIVCKLVRHKVIRRYMGAKGFHKELVGRVTLCFMQAHGNSVTRTRTVRAEAIGIQQM